jgi:hypothetical protein
VLRNAKAMESHAFPPIVRLHAADATKTAMATGRRVRRPKAIRPPTAMPAAGQKTALPDSSRRAKPSRPARRYAMPVATASVAPQTTNGLDRQRGTRLPDFSRQAPLMPLNVAVRRIWALTRLAVTVPTAKRIKEAGYTRRPEMIKKWATAGPLAAPSVVSLAVSSPLVRRRLALSTLLSAALLASPESRSSFGHCTFGHRVMSVLPPKINPIQVDQGA